ACGVNPGQNEAKKNDGARVPFGTEPHHHRAVLTGFEPAASTLTGWRALQTAPQDQAAPSRCGGQGRGRTGDLPLFRRTLVPTELPGPTDHDSHIRLTLWG